MKVLIFGGNGLLGREIHKLLLSKGITVDTVSRNNATFNFDISNLESFKLISGNIYDYVINAAAILPGKTYLDSNYLECIYRTNILGSQNICSWINKQTSIKKIINCSTLAVNNKPWPLYMTEDYLSLPTGNHVLYCMSKLMQEALFETLSNSKNIPVVHLRFSALYGPNMKWEGVIANFIDNSYKGKIEMYNGNKVFADFLHVFDASRIVQNAILSDITGVVNAVSGCEISLYELAMHIRKYINVEVVNIDADSFTPSRALISTDKLCKIIDVSSFKSISIGLKEIINKNENSNIW